MSERYSDNGAPCNLNGCQGTIYRYEYTPGTVSTVTAWCFGCHEEHVFDAPLTDDPTAAELSRAHRSSRGLGPDAASHYHTLRAKATRAQCRAVGCDCETEHVGFNCPSCGGTHDREAR